MTDLRMEVASAGTAPKGDGLVRFLKPDPFVFAGIWLFVVVHFVSSWSTIGNVFHDTDDAMRLVEVRDFLAGQGWFDLHQYRLDPPAGLPMHWSRFVDLPIAVLVRLFALVLDPATAEKAAMYLWPTLVLIPALFAVRRIACRLGGDFAALPAVYLMATCSPVIGQFIPGRIDHHNVQITATLWLVAFLLDPASRRRALKLALTTAFMMAVGMETLPFAILTAAAVALRFVLDGATRDEALAYGTALALATVAMMVATLPPAMWTYGACDALSANYGALAVVGGLGLAGLAVANPKSLPARAIGLGLVGALTVAAFAWPEPACLRGPFAQILPEVRKIWLDGVTEVQPWRVFFSAHHVDALVALLLPILAALAVVRLAADRALRTEPGFLVLVASAALATAIGLGQIRTFAYADVLSLPLVAAAIGRLAAETEARGRSVTVTVLVGTVLTSSSLATYALDKLAPASWKSDKAVITAGAGGSAGNTTDAAQDVPCMTLSNWRGLAALPQGLVAAEIDLGPSILAATPHSAIAAPYHRMQRGILDVDKMLHRPPAEALKTIDARKVDYVAICKDSAPAKDAVEDLPDSLITALMQGKPPARFEKVSDVGPIAVYRVQPATAFAGTFTSR